MAKTLSEMLPLGTRAPKFQLPDSSGKRYALDDFRGSKGLLVMFICNHCPFVKHVQHEIARLAGEYEKQGVAVVGINSNDAVAYPEDSPEKMAEEVRSVGYTFPYLYDETQCVAKAYHAACTPDFFLFDGDLRLVYRGQLDDSRPGNDRPVSGFDLRRALDALLNGEPIPEDQKPSMGCNIKWKEGNAPRHAVA
jgi:peroxiredoxin